MQDELIRKIAGMMAEQAIAYSRLESATAQLSAALTTGEPAKIESLTRAGESELQRMRSRLLEITTALTKFAEIRAAQPERTPLDAAARSEFELAAKGLLENARQFQRISKRATSLARNGSSLATMNIQMCGISPSTYRAPVLRYAEGAR